VEEERSVAREHARAVLDDERYLGLLDRLENAGDPPPATEPRSATLAEAWAREFRRLRRTIDRLDDDSTDAELHAARIRAKRARYAAELALHELGEPGERFVSASKRLQEVLGEHQDACVAIERITAWASEEGVREGAASLLAVEARRRQRARSAWPKAWK